jgi:CheY-like chemotaxis protein
MIRAYGVDGEPLAVQRLTRLLQATGRVDVVGSATDPAAALAFLRDHRMDVLFPDVAMPNLSGFDLLHALGADVPGHLHHGIRPIRRRRFHGKGPRLSAVARDRVAALKLRLGI